jgi:hypothetical protein
MYKDQLQGKKQEEEKQEYTVLDEITENEIPKEPENQNVQQEEQQVPQTLASVVRKSTRLTIPPERYSPSLYYLSLTDSGEPECYEEAMQVDTKKKWDQGMKEEMDSLSGEVTTGEVTTSLTGSAALGTSLTDSAILGFTGSLSYSSSRWHLLDFLSVASSSKVTSLLISIWR